MANYFMLGGDGKQYGPVTAEQLRQWVAEGRANSHTQVRSEANGTWQTFGTVPELTASASAFVASATHPALARIAAQLHGASGTSLGSDPTVKRLAMILAEGSGWIKLFALMMFLSGLLCVLTISGIIVAWIPFWLGGVLWGAANRAREAAFSGSEVELSAALDKLRFFFKLNGLLLIVGCVIAAAVFALCSEAVLAAIQQATQSLHR